MTRYLYRVLDAEIEDQDCLRSMDAKKVNPHTSYNMIKPQDIHREIELSAYVKQIDQNKYVSNGLRETLAWLRVGPFSGFDVDKGDFGGYWNKENYVFRGQSNSKWDICTTMERSTNKKQDLSSLELFERLSQFFINTVLNHDIVNMAPEFDEDFGKSAAQHYGLSTNLLDWSTQAEIAANFARDLKGRFDKGKIFLIKVSTLINKGLEVIFPPPIVRRIYNQRGIFINCDNIDISSLDQEIISIEFNQSSSLLDESILDKFNIADSFLLPEDEWFNSLKNHSEERVRSKDFKTTYETVSESFLFDEGYKHPYLQSIINSSIHTIDDNILLIIENMIKSLAIEYEYGKSKLNKSILENIESHNPKFFDWYYKYLQAKKK